MRAVGEDLVKILTNHSVPVIMLRLMPDSKSGSGGATMGSYLYNIDAVRQFYWQPGVW